MATVEFKMAPKTISNLYSATENYNEVKELVSGDSVTHGIATIMMLKYQHPYVRLSSTPLPCYAMPYTTYLPFPIQKLKKTLSGIFLNRVNIMCKSRNVMDLRS